MWSGSGSIHGKGTCTHQLANSQRFKKTNIFILRLYVVLFFFSTSLHSTLPPPTSHLPCQWTHSHPLPPTTATSHAAQWLQLQHHNCNTARGAMAAIPWHCTWCNDHDTPCGATTMTTTPHMAQRRWPNTAHCTKMAMATPHMVQQLQTTTPYVAQQPQPQHPMWHSNRNRDTPHGITTTTMTPHVVQQPQPWHPTWCNKWLQHPHGTMTVTTTTTCWHHVAWWPDCILGIL